ncbi:MAG: hypothetical protein AAF603_11010, partial [Pseudomonadota bacterium]
MGQNIHIFPFSLRFQDDNVEESYRKDTESSFTLIQVMSLRVGVCFYLGFIYFDFQTLDAPLHAMGVRLLGGMAVLIASEIAYRTQIRWLTSQLAMLALIYASLSTSYFIWQSGDPTNTYFVGLIIIGLAAPILLRLPLRQAIIIQAVTFISFLAATLPFISLSADETIYAMEVAFMMITT